MFDGKYPPSLEGVEPLTEALVTRLTEWGSYHYGSGGTCSRFGASPGRAATRSWRSAWEITCWFSRRPTPAESPPDIAE